MYATAHYLFVHWEMLEILLQINLFVGSFISDNSSPYKGIDCRTKQISIQQVFKKYHSTAYNNKLGGWIMKNEIKSFMPSITCEVNLPSSYTVWLAFGDQGSSPH